MAIHFLERYIRWDGTKHYDEGSCAFGKDWTPEDTMPALSFEKQNKSALLKGGDPTFREDVGYVCSKKKKKKNPRFACLKVVLQAPKVQKYEISKISQNNCNILIYILAFFVSFGYLSKQKWN